MNSLYSGLELALNFIEAYIWYKTTELFLPKRYKNIVYIILILCLAFLLCLKSVMDWTLNDIVPRYSTFIMIILFMLISTCIFFKGRLYNKILVSFLYFVAGSVINMIVLNVLILFNRNLKVEDFSISSSNRICAEILTKTILIIIIVFFYSRRKKLFGIEKKYTNAIMLMVSIDFILILFIYILFVETHYLSSEMSLFIINLSICLITVFFIYLISGLARESKEMTLQKLKSHNMEMKLQLTEDMKIVSNDLRRLRHDMNNHIAIIYGLSDTKQYDNLQRYIKDLYDGISYANDFVIAENETLSIILNFKRTLAQKKGIDLECAININTFSLTEMEISSLFGNIIDNAIEAAEIAEHEKKIELSLKEDKGGWRIACANPYKTKPVFQGKYLISTKSDKSTHGIGIRNVNDIITQYKGSLQYEITDKIFKVIIYIPK